MNTKRIIHAIIHFLAGRQCSKASANKPSRLYNPNLCMFFAVFICGLIAHGYAFFDAAFTHDSLNALYADSAENAWKISLGRIFIPAYQTLFRGDFAVPWLVGCLALLWIGCTLYLVIRMFKIRSPICIILTAGLLTTNLTVSLTTATYIHDLDANMFALLLSACAASQWNRQSHISAASILCIAATLSLYQSYVSVCIVLMLMRCMLDALHGRRFKSIVRKGITACITLILGATVYAVLLFAVQRFTGNAMNPKADNSLSNMAELSVGTLFSAAAGSYTHMYNELLFGWRSIFPDWFIFIVHALLFISIAVVTTVSIVNKTVAPKRIVLCVLLSLFIPPAVFLSTILSNGNSMHMLMLYALWLLYLLVVLLVYQIPVRSHAVLVYASRIISAVLILILIWGNIRTSNILYLVKDIQNEAASSLMTRVLYRMEDSDEYVTGTTPVAFIGKSNLISSIPGTERYANLVGMSCSLEKRAPEASYDPIYKMAANNLANPLRICNDDAYMSLVGNEEVLQMPCYPDDGCMKMIEDVFVVKLGN